MMAFYSHDQSDMEIADRVLPLGIKDACKGVLDHRGFVPVSCWSKRKKADRASRDSFMNISFDDIYQWFAIPTSSILYFLSGQWNDHFEYIFEEADIAKLGEEATQEALDWIRFVHSLCREEGHNIYRACGGGSDLEVAEPVATASVGSRDFLFVSMRYRDMTRRGTGQIFAALEFHEDTRQMVNYYVIYSTEAIHLGPLRKLAQIEKIVRPYVLAYLR